MPVNYPPVLEPIGDRTVSQGSLLEFTVQATDPDGDTLIYTASNLPPGAIFNTTTQVFSFKPESIGTHPDISFSVTDGRVTVTQTITILVLPVAGTPDGTVPLAVIYYGSVSPSVTSTILDIRPEYFICNTLHGMWGEISNQNPRVFHDISDYKENGIKVISYITAGYEGKFSGGEIDPKWYTLEMNRKFISDLASMDNVYGIFIDECSNFPDEKGKAYLKELTTLAHSYGLMTWGNVGTDNFDSWYFTDGGFDMVHSSEKWRGQSLNKVQIDWGRRISVTGFKPEYTARDALDLTVNAWRKGLAYCYITDATLGYNTLPPWLREYADLLRQYRMYPEQYQPPPEKGNTTGVVASTPKPSGAYNEYNFTFKIVSTTVTGLKPGQQLWCSSTTADFPNLLTPGATLTGDLDNTPGWWVLKNADGP